MCCSPISRPATKQRVNVISAVLALLFSLIVIWLSMHYVLQSWSISEGSANPGGMDYRYIVKSLIPIGFAMFALQSLSEAIKSYLAYRSA